MAIRPKGGFRNKTNPLNSRISLPDDNRAAPYRELAGLGQGMASVATKMWKISEEDRINREVNKKREEYALLSAQHHESTQNAMRDRRDGKVDDESTYSQAIYRNEDTALEATMSGVEDTEVRNRFMRATAPTVRQNKVQAVATESEYRVQSKITDNKRLSQQEAQIVAVQTQDMYMDAGRKAFTKQSLQFTEEEQSGMYNKQISSGLTDHSGASTVNTMLDKMVVHADMKSFNEFFGAGFKRTPDIKELEKQLITDGVVPKEWFKLQQASEDRINKFQDMREYATPAKTVSTYKAILNALRTKSGGGKARVRQQFRDLIGTIQTGSFDPVRVNTEIAQFKAEARNVGFDPATRLNMIAGLISTSQQQSMHKQTALLPITTKNKIAERLPDHLKLSLEEATKGDPELQAELKRVSAGGAVAANQKAMFTNMSAAQEKAKQDQSFDYILQNDTYLNQVWRDAQVKELPRSLELASNDVKRGALKAGVRPRNIKLMPSEYGAEIGSALDKMYAQGSSDFASQLSETIGVLKNQWGNNFPAMMNEMVEQKYMKQADDAIALASTIPNGALMAESFKDVIGLEGNRKLYNDSIRDKDGKFIFNFNTEMSARMNSIGEFFLSNSGNNSSPRAASQLLKYRKLVEARFYTLKKGAAPHKNDDEIMDKAFDQVTGRLFEPVKYRESKVLIPKSYNVPPASAQSAIKVLMRRAESAKIDIKAYEANYGKLTGLTEEAKRQIITSRLKGNLVVISPPPHGGQDGGAGLSVGIRSTRGIIPFFEMTEGRSQAYTIPFSSMRNNADVMVQTAEDADSILNQFLPEKF